MIGLLLVLSALAGPVQGVAPQGRGLTPEGGIGLASPSPDARAGVRAWSTTAVEALPDLDGDPRVRVAERLGLDLDLDQGMRATLRGGLRLTGDGRWVGDVWRASFTHTGEDHRIVLGRHVRLDARGLQRLDGISGGLDDGGPVAWSAWLGQRWHPEVVWARSSWTGGTETRLRPGLFRGTEVVVGVEGRQAPDQGFTARSWGALRLSSAYGRRASALVEGDAKGGLRAVIEASSPAGRYLDLGLESRWEDLPPSAALDRPRAPITWLAPDGYGTGLGTVRWSRGGWSLAAAGGPSVRPSPTGEVLGGGLGRATLARRVDKGELAVYAAAAGIGRARLAGGGAGVAWGGDTARVRLDGAAWYLVPLDRVPGLVTEVRGFGQADLARLGSGDSPLTLGLAGQVATGADRQLRLFARAGLAITGRWAQEAAP